MNDVVTFSVVLMAGILLGGFFFGGLWWTVQKGLTSKNPVLWFFGSTLLRLSAALAGFYFIAGNDWRKLLICLLGISHRTCRGDPAHAVAQERNPCTLVPTNLSFGSTASSSSMAPSSIPGALCWCSRWARN